MNEPQRQPLHLFIGTQDTGFYRSSFDEAGGVIGKAERIAEIDRPTCLLADRMRSTVFAVSEVGNTGDREGNVASFAIDRRDGVARKTSMQDSAGGGATHLTLAHDRNTLFVANFGGGQIAALPIGSDGKLARAKPSSGHVGSGPHRRQQSPHPHGVTVDTSGRYVLAPDMGADRIFIHGYNADAGEWREMGGLSFPLPAGSGPRLLVFGGDPRVAYLLTELSAEIFVLRWDADRAELTELARLSLDLPSADHPPSAAAITLSRDGRHLYASNRGTHEIVLFTIDPTTGLLNERQRIASGGTKPWHLELSDDGRWLLVANQGSDTVCLFGVDRETGLLAATDRYINVPAPTGLAFL